MTVKIVPSVSPAHPFEAYSHVVSPLNAEEGGGFVFTIPDLPGLLADANTADEAVADGREAFQSVVSAWADMGRELPAPTLKAAVFAPANASGRFVSRVPRSLHLRLTARATAEAEGVSLNALVMALIAEGLGRHDEAD